MIIISTIIFIIIEAHREVTIGCAHVYGGMLHLDHIVLGEEPRAASKTKSFAVQLSAWCVCVYQNNPNNISLPLYLCISLSIYICRYV